ncbi:MAG: ATP synthase F1 subunit delta [Alphaproteobacteria bacterium]|nr:ATP synthase F1 subunit delta [Alphaproteobacteria bacterium]
MSVNEVRRDKIAKRYGGVLFDLSQESRSLKKVLKEATFLLKCLEEESQLWSQVTSPVVPLRAQCQMIEKLASLLHLGSLMKRFLDIVCQNRRLQDLIFILRNFIDRTQLAEGVVEGVLETAEELSSKQIEKLQKSLKAQLGKAISLHQRIDEALLGGVILRVGSLMIDVSLRTQLIKFRQVLKG